MVLFRRTAEDVKLHFFSWLCQSKLKTLNIPKFQTLMSIKIPKPLNPKTLVPAPSAEAPWAPRAKASAYHFQPLCSGLDA